MTRQIFYILKWLIILILVFGLAFLTYVLVKVKKPLATQGEEKIFVVEKGSRTKEVAKDLQSEGLISREFFFKLYIYLKKQDGRIQAGTYSLSSTMPITEIAKIFVEGRTVSEEIKFRVIEGWNLSDITQELQKAGILSAKQTLDLPFPSLSEEFAFLKNQSSKYASLEGYLFPDTYLISKTFTPEKIVSKMLTNFDLKVSEDLRKEIKNQGKTLHEMVTLASIIEREVGRNVKKGEKLTTSDIRQLAEERRLVAGLFYNRLKVGMVLESDATITYLTGRRSNRATLEEIKIDSPYNTYKYPGLPAGPIASPSLDSIKAAIYPAKTDYLYFVTAKDGTAHFAKTLDEHIQNRKKYLE